MLSVPIMLPVVIVGTRGGKESSRCQQESNHRTITGIVVDGCRQQWQRNYESRTTRLWKSSTYSTSSTNSCYDTKRNTSRYIVLSFPVTPYDLAYYHLVIYCSNILLCIANHNRNRCGLICKKKNDDDDDDIYVNETLMVNRSMLKFHTNYSKSYTFRTQSCIL